jgi:outer membrane protein W
MKHRFLPVVAVILAASVPVLAEHSDYHRTGDLFRAHEFSVDLFGSLSVGQETIDDISGNRVKDDGRLGAGAGVNYFFTRNIGIGADAYSENTHDEFVDKASANLIIRFPFETAQLAPYVFGGGGRQFDPNEISFGQIGAGLEVRVNPRWAIFTDVRYMFMEKGADDIGLGRLGLRLAF